ncbi:MAG TPA: hypothetical protein VGC04_08395 [Cellulomonas sp.]
MTWLDPADPVPAQRAWLMSAHEGATLARTTVNACRDVPWVSPAADRYRAAVDDERGRLDRLLAAIDELLAGLGLYGPWPVTTGQVSAALSCQGYGGRSLRIGDGAFVSVDPEALADAADRLARAAGALDDASLNLARAQWGASSPWQSGGQLRGQLVGQLGGVRGSGLAGRIGTVAHGPFGPAPAAARLRRLGSSLRAAARAHGDGETGAHAVLRGVSTALGRNPLTGALAVGSRLRLAGARIAGEALWADLTGREPWPALVHGAERAWSDAAAGGELELAMAGVAAGLTAVVPTALPHPVAVASGGLAALLARSGADVELVPRVDPPQLAAPQGLAGVVDLVGRTYDEGQPTGLPGTQTATVTVQRLDHPDGARTWVVAVPGTQSWGLSRAVATDMGTNLALVGGRDDPMTAGVLAAMRAAGIRPDEPVVLAGHSQGGMVAMSAAAAAAGAYRIGGVVTAGSPSVPHPSPAGVPVVRLEHDEDVVPQTDGEPTPAGRDVTRITRSLAHDHPVLPVEAHQLSGYAETARMVDEELAAAAAPGIAAVTGLLGRHGTTATTLQYRVERAPGTAVPGGGGW